MRCCRVLHYDVKLSSTHASAVPCSHPGGARQAGSRAHVENSLHALALFCSLERWPQGLESGATARLERSSRDGNDRALELARRLDPAGCREVFSAAHAQEALRRTRAQLRGRPVEGVGESRARGHHEPGHRGAARHASRWARPRTWTTPCGPRRPPSRRGASSRRRRARGTSSTLRETDGEALRRAVSPSARRSTARRSRRARATCAAASTTSRSRAGCRR